MRMLRRLVPALLPLRALLPAMISACAQVQDVGSTTGGAADAGRTVDATEPADATVDDASASADASANLLPDPGFETDIVESNCGIGWSLTGTGTYATSPVAHTGAASCMVCGTTPGVAAILTATLPMPDAGVTLVPSTWLRGVEGTALADASTTATVAVDGCFPSCGAVPSIHETPDAGSWLLEDGHQVLVAAAGPGATTFFFEVYVADGCVLVDDVSLFAQ